MALPPKPSDHSTSLSSDRLAAQGPVVAPPLYNSSSNCTVYAVDIPEYVLISVTSALYAFFGFGAFGILIYSKWYQQARKRLLRITILVFCGLSMLRTMSLAVVSLTPA